MTTAPLIAAQPSLAILVAHRGRSVLVDVSGEIDIATAPQLAQSLRVVVDRYGDHRLVLDLTAVTFLGAAGLHLIADAQQRTQHHGGRTDVVSAEPFHRKLFAITGLDALIPVHRTVESAVAAQQRATERSLASAPGGTVAEHRDSPS
jgi:anti-anti-sigma factor